MREYTATILNAKTGEDLEFEAAKAFAGKYGITVTAYNATDGEFFIETENEKFLGIVVDEDEPVELIVEGDLQIHIIAEV